MAGNSYDKNESEEDHIKFHNQKPPEKLNLKTPDKKISNGASSSTNYDAIVPVIIFIY